MSGIALAAILASTVPAPVLISAHREGTACIVSVDGRPYNSANQRRLLADFRRFRRQGRSAIFRMQPDTPFRCIGAVVYLAQRARLNMPVGFFGNDIDR